MSSGPSADDFDQFTKQRGYGSQSFKGVKSAWKTRLRGWSFGALFFTGLCLGPFVIGPAYVWFYYGQQWDSFSTKLSRSVEGQRVSMWNRRNLNSVDTYYTQRPVDYWAYVGLRSYDITNEEKQLDYPVWRQYPANNIHPRD